MGKEFDKIQHGLMIKALRSLQKDHALMYKNVHMAKPITNIKLNRGVLKTFLLKLGRIFTLSIFIQNTA